MDLLLAAWSLKASATNMTLPSTNLFCDALHRASPDPERLGHLQNTHTLREQPSHLPFGHAVDLRAAEPVTSPLGFDCSINVYNPYSMRRAGKVYPHESDIQETHTKHRKLDSQAALPHPTRDRPADGLRPQAWPLWASRRDHDPGRLSPRPAGLGGLRPAMAADRAVRGPPARSPGEEWDSQRAPDPR